VRNEHLRNDKEGWHDKRGWISAFAGMTKECRGNDREAFRHDNSMRFLRCKMSTFGMTRRDGMTRRWLGRTTPLSSPCPFLSSPGLTGGSMHLCQRNGFPIDTFGKDGKSWIPDQVKDDKKRGWNDKVCA
jgi:hypothetical protein